ncbi:GNAT family N-acetyltransferase [Colwellia sp. D2M02]|uniref:GNAT family N-acetyltransferase n=1 Tax=Colwellia sp. D2M02 TaxID=2841562 RepID=UPI0025B0B527|nr:GNAT family N-acetyltransferase [Colwellia sp. D2M02]
MLSISTERLTLRPLIAADQDMFCQLYTSKHTMAYMSAPYSAEKAKKTFYSALHFNKNQNRVINTWAITLKCLNAPYTATNMSFGIVMVYDEWKQERLANIEVGVLLLPEVTKQGFAKEALMGLLGYCFNRLSLPQVNIRFHQDNNLMQIIARKLGFTSLAHKLPNNLSLSKSKSTLKSKNAMLVQQLTAQQWQAGHV